MKDCVFCKIYEETKNFFYENNYFWVNIDKYPVSPGHVEIIPKRHVVSEKELYKKEWSSLAVTILSVEDLIENTDWRKVYTNFLKKPLNNKSKKFLEEALNESFINTSPDGYNKGWNDGRCAGRTINHFHFHIIPRYMGDMKNPEGGVRYARPSKGNYKK